MKMDQRRITGIDILDTVGYLAAIAALLLLALAVLRRVLGGR